MKTKNAKKKRKISHKTFPKINISIKCIFCQSLNIIKYGKRPSTKNPGKEKQLYLCKDCHRKFTKDKLSHPINIIKAISLYNLGHSLRRTVQLLKNKLSISKSTVHRWLNKLKNLASYTTTFRKHVKHKNKFQPKKIITAKNFNHQQIYKFRLHNLKLTALAQQHTGLLKYLRQIARNCLDYYFPDSLRCSRFSFNLNINPKEFHSNIPRQTQFALHKAKNNHQRHEIIQNFLLNNDTSTIAVEVPVYLFYEELSKEIKQQLETDYLLPEFDEPLTGHIDILQVKNNKIYILDYKPKAAKENKQKVASQLILYANALYFRTKIPLKDIYCAYFDEFDYYIFKPAYYFTLN